MTLRFAYTRPDGGVNIVIAETREVLTPQIGKIDPATGRHVLSEEDYRAHVIGRSIPSDAIDVTELPPDWTPPDDRTFRNAWVLGGGKVSVDMPTAREIHRKSLQASADRKLAALTEQMLWAQSPQEQAQLRAQRQTILSAVRDPAIETARTPDELRAVLPEALRQT